MIICGELATKAECDGGIKDDVVFLPQSFPIILSRFLKRNYSSRKIALTVTFSKCSLLIRAPMLAVGSEGLPTFHFLVSSTNLFKNS